MKTAIYIEDGVVQLVLTPENKFEKDAIGSFNKGKIDATIFNGTFYDCRGGWVRQREIYPNIHHTNISEDDDSIIIKVAKDTGEKDGH